MLPSTVTSFVGRERELAALEDVLARERLVTLHGHPSPPGGNRPHGVFFAPAPCGSR